MTDKPKKKWIKKAALDAKKKLKPKSMSDRAAKMYGKKND